MRALRLASFASPLPGGGRRTELDDDRLLDAYSRAAVAAVERAGPGPAVLGVLREGRRLELPVTPAEMPVS
jgi:hypothetical protein